MPVTRNNGSSWTTVNTGWEYSQSLILIATGANLFAWGLDGVFLSADYVKNWSEINEGLRNTKVTSLVIDDSNLFVGIDFSRVWRRSLPEIIK